MLASAQQCLQNFPNFNDGISTFSDDIHRQLIIPQYSFPCNAVITRWEAHISGSVENLDNLEFQVWRFDDYGQKYHIMATSSLTSGDDITVLNRNGTVVVKLDSFKSRVPVEPGDVPGVFIRGSGVRITFFNHLNIATYVYTERNPPTFIIIDEEHIKSVAPLIWAQLEIDGKMWYINFVFSG